jgi:hypothetical protein
VKCVTFTSLDPTGELDFLVMGENAPTRRAHAGRR